LKLAVRWSPAGRGGVRSCAAIERVNRLCPAQNEIRTIRIHLSGETPMAGRESGKDNRGSANLNAAILEPSAGWQLALTFEEIP
jgi:hypothetical protein